MNNHKNNGKNLVPIIFTFIFLFLFSFTFVSSQGFSPPTSNSFTYYTGNLTNLSEMQDVHLPSPTDGNFLRFSTATNKWIGYTFSLSNFWDYNYADLINTPTALSDFTDDLGNRGYTSLSNFTNDLGIGNWTLDKPNYYTKTEVDTNISNANTSVVNWANNKFFPLSGGANVSGQIDFNGGWTSNGVSIINGDIYAQEGFFYNISGLNVTTLATNGSLLPTMDNQFNLGNQTYRWKSISVGTGTSSFEGNVGIGTTAPGAKLEVSGPTISGSPWISEVFRGYSSTYPSQYVSIFQDMSGASGGMSLGVAGARSLYIAQTTGNVGIGTKTPTSRLYVVQSLDDTTTGLQVHELEDTTRKNQIRIGADSSGSYIRTDYGSGGTLTLRFLGNTHEYMRILDGGNVGIGNTDPGTTSSAVYSGTKLEVGGTAARGVLDLSYSRTDNSALGIIGFNNRANAGTTAATSKPVAYIQGVAVTTDSNAGQDSGGSLEFYTKPEAGGLARAMTILGTGNVGIGTTTPQNPLNVIGAINATTGFIMGANTGMTGNYTNGNCWNTINGGIITATNCTSI